MHRQRPRQGQELGARIGKGLLVTAPGLVTGGTTDQNDQHGKTGDQPPAQPGGRMLGMGRKGVPQGRGQDGHSADRPGSGFKRLPSKQQACLFVKQ
ncbi:hypothetical protein LHK_00130 [Laribacter hongkongensis HLHK9]|uniref:Uncharacterized protein n=1 Tax=Laribacter hongkongensis (strain HLHK9) TaxID=557598 RepID=C1DA13_LARHH|nr:hypothetical protein LHK_00130 [Laribacter hongkongensis HLHK9]